MVSGDSPASFRRRLWSGSRHRRNRKKHFKGQPVPLRIRTESVMTNYFQSEVQKNLQFIQTRLREFKSSSLVVEVADKLKPPSIPPAPTPLDSPDTTDFTDEYDVTSEEYSSELVSPSIDAQGSLDKLAFIDAVLNRYRSASIQREAAAAASKAARASAPKSGSEAKKIFLSPCPSSPPKTPYMNLNLFQMTSLKIHPS